MTESITSFKGSHRFLSNFWPSPIRVKTGRVYPTVEHAYQCAKFFNAGNNIFHEIYEAKTAAETKKLAKKYKNHIAEDWDIVKYDYMKFYVTLKFEQNPDLATMLKETGDAELIEGNTWGDVYWGVCKGVGENNLGKILMEVREKLKHGTI